MDKPERKAHMVMTPEEYETMPIIGWHEVCRDVDGFGGVGIRFLGESPAFPSTSCATPVDHSGEECPNFPGCHCLNDCIDGWKHPSPEDGPAFAPAKCQTGDQRS